MEEKKEIGIIDRIALGNGPIRNLFRTSRLTEDSLSGEQKKLADAFREGIAEAIGIPIEYVDEQSIMNWIFEFTRSFVKPEHLKDTVSPSMHSIKMFGNEIGQIVRNAIEKLEVKPKPEILAGKIIKESPKKPKPDEGEKISDMSLS